ncbi:citrate (Si)-synthase [Corallococcus sp. H22C18031201]|uniref:citrate synthase n=1 Tax=Citreicoccus inhibens TaxID=2849499 RepID=UPI000E70AF2C|nr:citrate synthase [Citreicoccus inhibens]MBU8897047.1 citrate synthase [Citreicoccus inhibens]RJS19668.1 citrate (Si)-synthase [Corallococcus sp. H22C18031201]
MPKDTLTITDNRTGKTYEVPVENGCIRTNALRQIKVSDDDFGLMGYDPAFLNTANCKSAITFIDGDKGILEYRGYPIEQLAEKSSYLEVAYLLLNGELPTQKELDQFTHLVTHHTYVHENIKSFMDGFRYDAHPMSMLASTVAALSGFYPDAKHTKDEMSRRIQITRLIAKMPTIAAFSYRHTMGLPYIYPDNDLSYVANFLAMIKRIGTTTYKVHPVLERALDVLFILHADHEQNCSTTSVRTVGSSEVDPYSAVSAGIGALYGPLHGGANEAVLRMLREIGHISKVPDFIKSVKSGEGEKKLMGFGHRVYKSYDPRAKVIKRVADEVFEVTGKNPLLEIALELERIALQDEYFVKRKLYPNVDFYSGLIYEAMGFQVEMFPVLFAIPRTVGWCAQWEEMVKDPEQKIARPRQVFTGSKRRDYVAMNARTAK